MYVGFQTSLEPEVVTVNKILNLKEYLVDDIGVEEALFEGFSCSNVSLFFSIKLERLAFLIHWCYLHRRDFIEKFNVTLVFVPGHFVYSMEADQEYPFPEVGYQSLLVIHLYVIHKHALSAILCHPVK